MIVKQTRPHARRTEHDPERRILLHGLSWEQYEDLLAALGDSAGVRVAYLNGTVEIMSPSEIHEQRIATIVRLLYVFAEEARVELNGYRSTTFRRAATERGIEPDECFTVDRVLAGATRDVPDIALEVIHTNPLLDELSIYAGLAVPEVWLYQDGKFDVHAFASGKYQRRTRSRKLPGLDLGLMASFVDARNPTDAARRFRRALRGRP